MTQLARFEFVYALWAKNDSFRWDESPFELEDVKRDRPRERGDVVLHLKGGFQGPSRSISSRPPFGFGRGPRTVLRIVATYRLRAADMPTEDASYLVHSMTELNGRAIGVALEGRSVDCTMSASYRFYQGGERVVPIKAYGGALGSFYYPDLMPGDYSGSPYPVPEGVVRPFNDTGTLVSADGRGSTSVDTGPARDGIRPHTRSFHRYYGSQLDMSQDLWMLLELTMDVSMSGEAVVYFLRSGVGGPDNFEIRLTRFPPLLMTQEEARRRLEREGWTG